MSIQGPPSYQATLTVSPLGPNPTNSPVTLVLQFSEFSDDVGTPFDPTLADISIVVMDPTMSETTYTSVSSPAISKYAVGVYSIEIEGNKAGNWLARGQGPDPSGNMVTSQDAEITFLPTEVS
jgi:hypothetical protein